MKDKNHDISWYFAQDNGKDCCWGFCVTEDTVEAVTDALKALERKIDKQIYIQSFGRYVVDIKQQSIEWLLDEKRAYLKEHIEKDLGPFKPEAEHVIYKVYEKIGDDWFPRIKAIKNSPNVLLVGLEK